jgi:hypothetical protein
MPNSKVLQAELMPQGSIAVTVELSHLEPGEQALVQTSVTQAKAVAEATALVTGASPAGPQQARLVATPRGEGRFTHDEPLVAFTHATTVWTTRLTPVTAVGTPPKFLWGDGSGYGGGND